MLTRTDYSAAQKRATQMILESGIRIKEEEKEQISVADFGLSDLALEGGQILTFFNTNRISTKIIVLFPEQTLPEHWHPSIGNDPGKEEIVRVISGTLYFYIPGEPSILLGHIPSNKENYYTVRHEIVMQSGDQIVLAPGIVHWFQAGNEGAVMYSFSTTARDILDCFSDPNIVRTTKIVE